MYIPDLAKYSDYYLRNEEVALDLIAVGWLDSKHSYLKGNVSLDFKKRLEIFCSNPVILDFGFSPCALCSESVTIETFSGGTLSLFGTYEIRLPSLEDDKIYAAPDLILHYVLTHKYKPPQEFIDAVLATPLPGTPEFKKFAEPWSEYH